MRKDMKRLETIMAEFSLYPVIIGSDKRDPISRLIFCNILADLYPELRNPPHTSPGKSSLRSEVANYLGYADTNSIKFQLRDGSINSIMEYKDYHKKYKIIKAQFENNELYLKLKSLQILRDDTQNEMTEIMNKILKG